MDILSVSPDSPLLSSAASCQSPLPPYAVTNEDSNKILRSTKYVVSPIPLSLSPDLVPSSEPANPKTCEAFTRLVDTKNFERSYSDQTGRFSIQSSRGNKYIFIMYDYDSNAILSVALPDRRGSSIRAAWLNIFYKLQSNGYAPKLHVLDNECSLDLKRAFIKK